jgi:hypothetical protein
MPDDPSASDPATPDGLGVDPAALRLEYTRLCGERDRLRAARGRFSLGLGPAPASAGIATTIAATATNKPDHTLLTIAICLLGALVFVGVVYDGKPAYRLLRARSSEQRRLWPLSEWRRRLRGTVARWGAFLRHPIARLRLRDDGVEAKPEPCGSEIEWLEREIRQERELIGGAELDNHWRPPWARVTTLQEGVDSERTGARLVGLLWVAVIAVLLAAVT